MLIFKENSYGGIDLHNEKDKFLVHLNNDDLKKIYAIQQKNYDVDTVMNRIPDWVTENTEQDDYFFADFNSHLFSYDEISTDEIKTKFLSDEKLICNIADKYREDCDSGVNWWTALNNAIESSVSIKDVLGEILCDKHPKELLIGKWRVNVVEKGDSYGEKGVLCHEDAKLLVEFYDMSQDKKKFPNGQFTSGRYYLDTLLSSEWSMSLNDRAKAGIGLELCGGVDAWVVSPGDLNVIGAWLSAVNKHFELEQAKDVKVRYSGEVDVPFEYGRLAESNNDVIPAKVAADMLASRLNVVPEFDNVFVEQFGEYDWGFGFSFSFFTTVDDITAQAVLKHVLNGLKYEAYRETADSLLENRLNQARERSRQYTANTEPNKDGRDVSK